MKRSASLCLFLVMLLSLTSMASAQETRGSIEGVVKDSSGAVLPGVTLEARTAPGWRGYRGERRGRQVPVPLADARTVYR